MSKPSSVSEKSPSSNSSYSCSAGSLLSGGTVVAGCLSGDAGGAGNHMILVVEVAIVTIN